MPRDDDQTVSPLAGSTPRVWFWGEGLTVIRLDHSQILLIDMDRPFDTSAVLARTLTRKGGGLK